MKRLLVGALGVLMLSAAPAPQTFRGVITDDNCVNGDHSLMKMGDDDRECAIACVNAHGSSYVLFDGKGAYTLSDQRTSEKFAGQKVVVTGVADEKSKKIDVTSIVAQK